MTHLPIELQAVEDETGLRAYYLDGAIVAYREPGWYTPASDVIVEIGECTIKRFGRLHLPVTVRDPYNRNNAHSFTATNIRGENGETAIRRSERYIIKCPDRPAVGYWRKVEGIEQ